MVKVVYFDEDVAVDYLDVYAGGREARSTSKNNHRTNYGGVDAQVEASAKFHLVSYIRASLGVDGKVGASSSTEKMVNQTISNTILTDYIEKVGQDNSGVEKLDGYSLEFPNPSFSLMRMMFPYLRLEDESANPEIFDSIEKVFSEIKGYYEMLATCEGRRVILRFNSSAFRHNYKYSDMLSMGLTYYAVPVGIRSVYDLKLEMESLAPVVGAGEKDLEEERLREGELARIESESRSRDLSTDLFKQLIVDEEESVSSKEVDLNGGEGGDLGELHTKEKGEEIDEREPLKMYDVVLAGVEVSLPGGAS
ncbi:DUF6414 family protein [uncultured Actinomyces sp.]|uniref:DUF6414 family protein n=1 Tax=uncultured Actinomyces sp. TaxID=249061 RepID=UPI002618D8ED|nr:DUF6414 family protein [uncultured Actinomyces sp.]